MAPVVASLIAPVAFSLMHPDTSLLTNAATGKEQKNKKVDTYRYYQHLYC